MDGGSDKPRDFGSIVRQHRLARGLDIEQLCSAIGGTPGPGFLKSLEDASIGPSSSLVLKLAEALELPADLMLNAAGFATQAQRSLALAALPGVSAASQRET
jgi:transcriptional regulator with XRE-family HTH domain